MLACYERDVRFSALTFEELRPMHCRIRSLQVEGHQSRWLQVGLLVRRCSSREVECKLSALLGRRGSRSDPLERAETRQGRDRSC